MRQPENFGHHEGGRRRAHERHGDRFAGELESAALVFAEARIARIVARDAALMLSSLLFFVLAEIGPQLGGAFADWARRAS